MAPLPNASSLSTMSFSPEVQCRNGQVSCGSPSSLDSNMAVGGVGFSPDMPTASILTTTDGTPDDPTSMDLLANHSTGSQPHYQLEDHGSARTGVVQHVEELYGYHGQNTSVEDIPLMQRVQIEHQAEEAQQQQIQESSGICDLSILSGETTIPEPNPGDSSLTVLMPERILPEAEIRETYGHRCERRKQQSGSGGGSSGDQQAEALREHESRIRHLSNGGRERDERSAQLTPSTSGDQVEGRQSPEFDSSEVTQLGHIERTWREDDFRISCHFSDGEEHPSTLPSSEPPSKKLLHIRKHSVSKFHEQLGPCDEPCDRPMGRLQRWWEKLKCQVIFVRRKGFPKVRRKLQNKSYTKGRIKGR